MSYRVGLYYRNLCPFHTLASFCTLNGTYLLKNKEFALRYNINGKDTYSRYEKYDTREELEERCEFIGMPPPTNVEVLKIPRTFMTANDLYDLCVEKRPSNVHVGAVYPGIEREIEKNSPNLIKCAPLVFDADMEDFLKDPNIRRYCKCKDRQICDDCYMAILQPAAKDLKDFLTEMGFRAILLVYSGRRGFHCFVLDKHVWNWTGDQRATLLGRIPPSVHLDEGVTKDVRHICKLPLMPHQATGVVACPIMDVDVFRPSTHTFTVLKLTEEKNAEWAKNQVDAWARHIDDCIHFALQPRIV